jgi:hypothetical protein
MRSSLSVSVRMLCLRRASFLWLAFMISPFWVVAVPGWPLHVQSSVRAVRAIGGGSPASGINRSGTAGTAGAARATADAAIAAGAIAACAGAPVDIPTPSILMLASRDPSDLSALTLWMRWPRRIGCFPILEARLRWSAAAAVDE